MQRRSSHATCQPALDQETEREKKSRWKNRLLLPTSSSDAGNGDRIQKLDEDPVGVDGYLHILGNMWVFALPRATLKHLRYKLPKRGYGTPKPMLSEQLTRGKIIYACTQHIQFRPQPSPQLTSLSACTHNVFKLGNSTKINSDLQTALCIILYLPTCRYRPTAILYNLCTSINSQDYHISGAFNSTTH